MKRNIFTLFFAAISITAYTQELSWFQAEQNSFYEVKGCNANSDIQFYSQKGGGKMLRQVTVNNDGNALIQTPLDFNPAFVLSMKNKNSKDFSDYRHIERYNHNYFYY